MYRKLLDSRGPGGIKCKCCRPTNNNKKCRKWSRQVRRILKQLTYKEYRCE